MKNTGTILASVIGGAILGSALTCLLKSAKASELKKQAHEKIMSELKHLHAHMAGVCNCTEGGECSCGMEAMKGAKDMAEVPSTQTNE
ncbi:MAG: hypothetical protein SNG02_02915 [Rikenellaceae bacterium]